MKHVLVARVQDEPGVLNRVASLFRRRAFNIDSLTVGASESAGFSRMTIVCRGDRGNLEQIVKQLQKLIDVVNAIDHTGDEAYETEIVLVKLQAEIDRRTQILQIAEHFGAKVVDYGQDSLILRAFGSTEKLDSFIELLRPFGLIELVRSGKILMARGLRET